MSIKLIIITVISFGLFAQSNDLSEIKKEDVDKSKSKINKSSSKWSGYQGAMDWEEAKKKCASIKMRLPTIKELKTAHSENLMTSWETEGYFYWSSEPMDEKHAYTVSTVNADVSDVIREYRASVRCIKK